MFRLVLSNLTSLCLLMLIGYILRRAKIITDEVNTGLSAILLKVALPCTILMSMQRDFSVEMLTDGLIVFGVAFVLHFLAAGLGAGLTRLCKVSPTQRGLWLFALSFANVAYMGYPVIKAIYGDEALFYVAMNNVAFNLLFPTLGYAIILYGAAKTDKPAEKARFSAVVKRLAVNEALVATVIGLTLFVASIRLPAPVGNALTMAGSLTTPVSMMIIGGLLAKNSFKLVFSDVKIYVLAAMRLFILPLAVWLILRPFIQNELMLGVMTYLVAMPAGAVLGIVSVQKGADGFTASKIVFMTTVLSLCTIPLLSLII